jgi:NAD(P)-dependent dehydrogenase (short-subunit alcohol dehydrogenase family)
MTNRPVLVVGNSDGIGLELTRRLLERGYRVLGVSRRKSPLSHEAYRHVTVDVTSDNYVSTLDELLRTENSLVAVYYCAAISARTELDDLSAERRVFDVNLMGAVRTAERLLPVLSARGGGRFIVLSSQADGIVNHEA